MSIEGQGHFFTIYFPGFVCFVLYLAKISGERLQDHWSSGFYKLTCALAHRRAYSIPMDPASVVRRRRRPQCSNIFFSETAWPIKAKFYVEPPWVGGTKVCSRHLGHMTKMAVTPIMVKTLKKSSSPEPAGRFSRNLVCSIGDSCPS